MAGLLRSGMLLGLALMAGRLAGFVRELVLASNFGLSVQADVAIVLLTLPDLLVNLLLSGGLSVALVPALRSAEKKQAAAFFTQTSMVVLALFGVMALLLLMAPSLWLKPLALGIALPEGMRGGWIWALVAVAMPLTALSGVSSAALNARDRFFVAGCGTLIFNVCVIVALWLAPKEMQGQTMALVSLCIGIAVGALLRWLSQLAALRADLAGALSWQPWALDRALLRSFGAGLAAASLLILVPVLIRSGASLLGEGKLAAFNYATKLVELPLGILITTLATVAFPRLSELHARAEHKSFGILLGSSLQRSMLLSLIVVLCGWQFVDALISMLFAHGKLDADARRLLQELTRIALLSVPCIGVSALLTAALNARREPGVVLRCTVLALLALPLICLPGVLAQSAQGLMWALPAVHGLLALLLMRALHMRLGRSALAAGMPFLVAALLCIAGWWIDAQLLVYWDALPDLQQAMVRSVLAGVVFAMAAAVGLWLLSWKNRSNKNDEAFN